MVFQHFEEDNYIAKLIDGVVPEWRSEFRRFVETGEAEEAFLSYLNQDSAALWSYCLLAGLSTDGGRRTCERVWRIRLCSRNSVCSRDSVCSRNSVHFPDSGQAALYGVGDLTATGRRSPHAVPNGRV